MPRDYTISVPGRRSLTLSAESISDAAEQWAVLAQLDAGDDRCIDVLDGAQRYRVRVTIDQGHAVTGEPWRVFEQRVQLVPCSTLGVADV